MGNVFKSDSGTLFEVEKQIGEGGQGYIFLVKNDAGDEYALKWYKESRATSSQKEILETVINNKPNSKNSDVSFIWPLYMVSHPNSKSFGYVMPLYDSKRFINYNKVINGRAKRPSVKSLSYVSFLIANAIEAVHREGMAYCDVNLGNIQFDFNQNEIIVCDNDNVVVNNSDVNILGVPEFMAPEVALKKNKPNSSSDLYSLAIMLYMLWMYEHPMEGKKTDEVRCWDLVAKTKFYHAEPLFVHHPSNKENSIENVEIYKLSLALWNFYPSKRCKDAFIKTFTEGADNPNKRTRTSQWQTIFLEMYSNTMQCPYCGAEVVFDPDKPKQRCPNCKKELPLKMILNINFPGSKMRVVVQSDTTLYPYHFGNIDNVKNQQPLAKIESHPKKKGAYIIRNLSDRSWKYKVEDKQYTIEPKQARVLIPNGIIEINGVEVQVTKES